MKKVLFAVAALATVSTIPAIAADMRARPAPAYKAAPAMVAAHNWTGFYIGGQVGYQSSDDDHSNTSSSADGTTTGPFLFDSDGAVYGGHAGFNWQVGQWVWGIEGDYEGSGVDGGYTLATGIGASPAGSSLSLEQKWQASIRGRLGWAWDRALLYVTGGFAWSEFDVGFTTPAGGGFAETLNDTMSGWTIGAGVEWALWQNWSARVEYRYTDFDSFSRPTTVLPIATTINVDDLNFHTIRFGVSWRFGDWGKGPMAGKGPVVGKY